MATTLKIKRLRGPVALFVAGVILLVAGNVAFLRSDILKYEPLGDYPVQIVANRIPGIDIPAAYRGDPLLVTGTRCVKGKYPVAVSAQADWVRRDVSPSVRIPLVSPGSIRVREPGCVTRYFSNILPEQMEPGIWRYEAVDIATKGDKTQAKAYWSEDFRVVNKP